MQKPLENKGFFAVIRFANAALSQLSYGPKTSE
jgi:hypothetical protein